MCAGFSGGACATIGVGGIGPVCGGPALGAVRVGDYDAKLPKGSFLSTRDVSERRRGAFYSYTGGGFGGGVFLGGITEGTVGRERLW